MNALIPAICTNSTCGTVFFVTNMFAVAEGRTVTLTGCKQGPCPTCGAIGAVPNGLYQNLGTSTLFTPRSPKDRAVLENALRFVQEAINTDMPATDFQEAAKKRSPELSALWRLMPETQSEACQFWLLVCAVITVLLLAYQASQGSKPNQLMLPPEILRAIQNARPDSPDDTHTKPPEKPQE